MFRYLIEINISFFSFFQIYIMLILMRSSTIVFGDNAERVYSIHDKVTSCSGWLSTIIFNFCNNAYKIVKRGTSLMIGYQFIYFINCVVWLHVLIVVIFVLFWSIWGCIWDFELWTPMPSVSQHVHMSANKIISRTSSLSNLL